MADKKKKDSSPVTQDVPAQEIPMEETTPVTEDISEENTLQAELAAAEDKYLRLAAEYDNFRKRTAKEKETIWAGVKADTAAAFLSVYDNLERAVKQSCSDDAYAKGVEMTMTGLKDVLGKLGIEEIPALGETFDPEVHNAVMHIENPDLEENTIAEVYQVGFKAGDKVLRHSMVVVAN